MDDDYTIFAKGMNDNTVVLIDKIHSGEIASLSRAITIIENELEGHEKILESLQFKKNSIITGITGPPGAGKSTLINCLISHLSAQDKKVAVIAIDPTSPFSHGSLLGDRLRMAEHFQRPNVFIRSVATRGSLGGVSDKTFEIADILRAGGYDYIFIETVGVGQSEVDIASLADTTIVVLVPGAGDEIQAMKSGILEIADIFVINKSDHDDTQQIYKDLTNTLHLRKELKWKIPILKTIATQNDGFEILIDKINEHYALKDNHSKAAVLAEKAYRLIRENKMRSFNRTELEEKLKNESQKTDFNLYSFVKNHY